MTVEEAVRLKVPAGAILHTPTRNSSFVVDQVDSAGIVLLLGAGAWHTRISWECLEGIVPFVQGHGGQVPIGGRHQVEGNPGTLDQWLKGCVKRTTAGWVAVVLEQAGILDIVHERPALIRLASGWR